ncbi:hypothetical protein ACFT2C_06155 [Promicromonospora sp. NPDC057138]|uniref:hypothetical protein n=1 Tax=Promicromonospora sp. NPDC057138 TaxID=3346031 RepID=UPI003632388D
MAERLDPFWDGVWSAGSSGVWVSSDTARRLSDAGVARIPWYLRGERDDGLAFLARRMPARRRVVLAGLGAVNQWRTMTAEQLAAITGFRSLASRASPWLRAAFSTGVVDVGEFATPLPHGTGNHRHRLVRPSRSTVFDRELAPHMTFDELVSVTGGVPWDSRRQFDRHNLLATELGLRVAELCDVATVLGEKLSTLDLLLQAPAKAITPRSRARSADLTIVRRDGLRIAVEITASANRGLRRKIDNWARALARNPLAASGLIVLFVVCPPPDPASEVVRGGRTASVVETVHREVAASARRYPGTPSDRVAARMAVMAWEEWFPAARTAAAGVHDLVASRPTGPPSAHVAHESRLWESVSLLGTSVVPFEPRVRLTMTAVAGNASLLGGTPHWLRVPGAVPDVQAHHAAGLGLTVNAENGAPTRNSA